MSKRRFGKKGASLGTVLALLTVTFAAAVGRPLPVAALEGYTNGRMSLVTEPEAESSPYVAYHTGGEEVDWSQLTWVDGRNGQGSGVGRRIPIFTGWRYAAARQSFPVLCHLDLLAGPVSAEADPHLRLLPAPVHHDQQKRAPPGSASPHTRWAKVE